MQYSNGDKFHPMSAEQSYTSSTQIISLAEDDHEEKSSGYIGDSKTKSHCFKSQPPLPVNGKDFESSLVLGWPFSDQCRC